MTYVRNIPTLMKISGRIESGRMQAVYTNEIIFVPNQHKHVFVFFLIDFFSKNKKHTVTSGIDMEVRIVGG